MVCSGRAMSSWHAQLILGGSLAVVFASDVGDVGEDNVLFCEGFVDEVLEGSIHVAFIVGSDDFLRKLTEQRGWKTVKRQVHEKVIFCDQDCVSLFHARSTWDMCLYRKSLKRHVQNRPSSTGQRRGKVIIPERGVRTE